MLTTVVTGGAGFIGSHLSEELAQAGYRVIIFDDLSAGKEENIAALLKRSNVEFIKGSINDPPLLGKVFQGVHYVFHLAAITSVFRSVGEPLASHDVNATGTLNVLLAARDNHVSKVIYASSSSVYGDTPTLPKKEGMTTQPLSPYAVAKLAGEHYCGAFKEVYGLDTICLRYFNVYGPRQDPNSQYAAVIPRFIQSIGEGSPPVIFGDGEQTRDFTFVKDVVTANILAAQSDASGTFNASRGESVTINQLAELIIELIGNRIKPVHQEPRPGDIRDSLADCSKAEAFGYRSQYDIKTGLNETVRWYLGG